MTNYGVDTATRHIVRVVHKPETGRGVGGEEGGEATTNLDISQHPENRSVLFLAPAQ